MKQIPLAIGPDPLPTFDTYLTSANAAAVAHLRALDLPSAPVYLWGPPGSGKSHLLRALVHQRHAVGERAGSFDADDPAPWQLQPGWTLVVVDRCDQLDAERQQAAFALFVQATDAGVQWAAAGRVPPVDLACATTCARAWPGAMCSRCRPAARTRPAPRCAARPTGAASSWPTR